MPEQPAFDIEDARRAIEGAEVVVVGFSRFEERLLLDFRYDAATPPAVKVVPAVSSVEERLWFLQQERPQFAAPVSERFVFFTWPKTVAEFRESSVWRAIEERIRATGHGQVLSEAHDAWGQLATREKHQAFSAVKGEHFKTLWREEKR